jgi:hypothetical protein
LNLLLASVICCQPSPIDRYWASNATKEIPYGIVFAFDDTGDALTDTLAFVYVFDKDQTTRDKKEGLLSPAQVARQLADALHAVLTGSKEDVDAATHALINLSQQRSSSSAAMATTTAHILANVLFRAMMPSVATAAMNRERNPGLPTLATAAPKALEAKIKAFESRFASLFSVLAANISTGVHVGALVEGVAAEMNEMTKRGHALQAACVCAKMLHAVDASHSTFGGSSERVLALWEKAAEGITSYHMPSMV